MMRIYSDVLIATEVRVGTNAAGIDEVIVVCEDTDPVSDKVRGEQSEVCFYGRLAREVSGRIVAGVMFTFRGVYVKGKIVARSYATIA